MLSVKELSKQIRGKSILKNVSFHLKKGEIAIFLGGSGVGKSTLLRVINQLEGHDSGALYFPGSVGMVFQHFNLFEHLTVEENVILPLVKCKKFDRKTAHTLTHALLKRYGLEEKAQDRIQQLSGGQRQRLAIARSVALNPEVICFDEPTSALDPRLTATVAHYIKELAQEGKVVLLTTHDMKLLDYLEGKLFLMEGGAIAETASKQDFIATPFRFPKLQNFINYSAGAIEATG